MIAFSDHLIELALSQALATVKGDADPVARLASILPSTLGTLRTDVATKMLTSGINIESAYRLTFREGVKPTLAVALEHMGTPDRATFGFDHTIDPATLQQYGYLMSVATVRVFAYATTRLEVRALIQFVRSAMLSFGDWLMKNAGEGGTLDSFHIGPTADLEPDKDLVPNGVSMYVSSVVLHLSGIEKIQYLTEYTGTVGEFLSLAEYPRTVDAEPDTDTQTFVAYGVEVSGEATPEE